ncbi:acetate/propionate family kinase [Paenibacillus tepidiphilus]|uniref:acetate/propionate family kinase n=1 Tax=Paenibacillus tepidiphilus TaxID=2608683 RepID=UPI001239A2CD|nr:acetate kinase [Paenibacillus tepidiphilus]
MNVLVINSGSSSLKYQLYNMTDESVLAKGLVERIGMDSSILTHKPTGKPEVTEVSEILEHNTAIRKVLACLTDSEHGVIASIEEINAVGHRVVHGGEFFNESVLVEGEVKHKIRQLFDLAPLHNPAGVMGITATEINMPGVPQVAVFDTAFHQTMPEKAYMYAIPRVLYNKYKVRRYGAHGTSHDFVSKAAAEYLDRPLEDLKIITCHIGNGASVTAVDGGVSVDTSMGMTPLEGLMMGTRSGDIDPAVVPYVMNKEELSVGEVNSMLNKHSGLLAISGVSSDMRDIIDGAEKGEPNSTLAFEMYEYRLRKYIGSYAAAMNGVDVIVFTAGVGENASLLREKVLNQLTFLGIQLDVEANKVRSGDPRRISTADSKVQVLVVPTNEELVIARDTYRIVQGVNG